MAKEKVINKSANLMNSLPQQILIVFSSGIGNMVLFLPTLMAIRDKYPNAEITLWAKEISVSEMINKTCLIDEVWPYYHKKFTNIFPQLFVYRKLRKKKYDIIITTFIEQGYKIRLFIAGLRGKMKLGYRANAFTDHFYTHLFDYNVNKHESDNHFKIAEFLDGRMIQKKPDLGLQNKEQEFAKRFFLRNNIPEDKLVVGLHPGCSEFARNKRWLPENFAKVADVISEQYNAEIIIFGGKEEISLAKKVAGYMCSCVPLSLAGRATILETAAVIKKCNLFISNDSGLMHIASAVNTPTIAVFGPTNPVKNSPLGKNHFIVKKDFPCSPCSSYLKNRCDNIRCLKAITIKDVLTEAEKQLTSLMSLNR